MIVIKTYNNLTTFHNEKRECDVMNYYNTLKTQVQRLKIYAENNPNKKEVIKEYKKVLEELQIFEFMYNKEFNKNLVIAYNTRYNPIIGLFMGSLLWLLQ